MSITSTVIEASFAGYDQSVPACLEEAGLAAHLDDARPVMLKPNLVNDSPHPVTTPPALCAAVIDTLRRYTKAPIVIAEGCGDAMLETDEVFQRLGYTEMAARMEVELLDLNRAELVCVRDASCELFPEMWLPQPVFDYLLISLPVLKAHSLCQFTGSMKNMMGLLPPSHYAGCHGTWKKAVFHHRLDRSIVELNRYRSPDFTLLDASVGLADFHLGGACCDPPVNRLLAGADARSVDRHAADLLGLRWAEIGHLAG